jgi:predicted kinase
LTDLAPEEREVVVLIGLQGSGKSSFHRERFAATHRLISKDLYPKGCNKQARQRRELEAALEEARRVVVDNTQPSLEERAPVIAQARAAGARVIGYYFSSRVADCLRRNAGRSGAARVPDVAILSAAKRLQRPNLEEGFDQLWFVSMVEGNGFLVRPWGEAEDLAGRSP